MSESSGVHPSVEQGRQDVPLASAWIELLAGGEDLRAIVAADHSHRRRQRKVYAAAVQVGQSLPFRGYEEVEEVDSRGDEGVRVAANQEQTVTAHCQLELHEVWFQLIDTWQCLPLLKSEIIGEYDDLLSGILFAILDDSSTKNRHFFFILLNCALAACKVARIFKDFFWQIRDIRRLYSKRL